MNETLAFDINKSIELLSGDFTKTILKEKGFSVWVSCFFENVYNFIIPSVGAEQLDQVQVANTVAPWQNSGYNFSYYIPLELHNSYLELVRDKQLLYKDLYTYKSCSQKYEIEDETIVDLTKDNLELFMESTDICFPNWNNRSFTEWCLNTPSVSMIGVVKDGKIASFGAIMQKEHSDYVLLMNAGTLPEYRRQGMHEYMIKARINRVLTNRQSAVFYANVEPNEASHLGFKKLDFEDGPTYFVHELKKNE